MARRAQKRTAKTRLFLVDDEAAVRRGLQVFLSQEPNLEVCGAASSMAEALKQIPLLAPDLAVVDLSLGSDDGLKLIRELRRCCPRLKVLVFSMHDQPSWTEAASREGAHGYVAKHEGAEKLIEAINSILPGQACASPVPSPSPSCGDHSARNR